MAQDTNGAPRQGEVCILLGLYQGAPYLRAQLDSFARQTYAQWSLIVSDDGSNDAGPDILAAFQGDHPGHRITCRPGPGQGFARNFLSLLQSVPGDVPFAALSDQDDVWFDDKLARAVRMLAGVPAGIPALYCAGSTICDAALTPLRDSRVFARPPDFRNALVQSIGGGNTMVLNRAALDLAAAAAGEASDPVAHDWWLYQLITACGGRILREDQPVLFYRQHADNLIGANLSMGASLSRILALLGGRFRAWNSTNLKALSGSRRRFTPQARQVLAHYESARSGSLRRRMAALRASGVYRQSLPGNIALYAAAALNRL